MLKAFSRVLNVNIGIDEESASIPPTTSLKPHRSSFLGPFGKSRNGNANASASSDISGDKICIGDRVTIMRKGHTSAEKGVVLYIGYPFPKQVHMRYGINLSNATGAHDGSFMIDIKTGKLAKQEHITKYKKRIKRRKYFEAKPNHGVFVKKEEISSIDRLSTAETRFTVEDDVEVRFRGVGTIKFIGTLQHTREMGVWYGIQLKERRGRHDGTVNGIKYFECTAQYGLHCRPSHLTLIESHHNNLHNLNGMDTPLTHSRSSEPQFDDNPALTKARPSFTDKPQTSVKWAKVLGFPAAPARGTARPAVSELRLNVMPVYQKSESTSMTQTAEPQTLRLVSVSQQKQQQVQMLKKHNSLSTIMPPDVFRHNLSVNVLPGMIKKPSKSTLARNASLHGSIKRGATTVVLPGYYNGLKQRRFTDHFDMDEIDDFLGEGEFGVVYKCRKVDYEDEYSEYSTTMRTTSMRDHSMITSKILLKNPASITEDASGLFPGDMSDSESADSYNSDNDSMLYAVKKIKKAKFHHLGYKEKQKAIQLLQQEIKLLEKIQRMKKLEFDGSEYVIDLEDVFEDRNYLYIVTNYCAGGNLWSYIEDQDEESHHEKAIQKIMKQMLQGLVFLHVNNMAHLDIKPDNIMFTQSKQIQLIDFGVSSVIPPLHKAGVLKGTPNYVAPEVIEGFYDKKADVWSIGVIFFMLRFGYPPFYIADQTVLDNESNENDDDDSKVENKEHQALFELIKKGFDPVVKKGLGAWFPAEVPVSQPLKDLIASMLEKDLAKRLTAAECLAHPYFKDVADAHKLPLTVMDALTKFSGQCQFKVMISRLFVHQIKAQQMNELKEVWNKFDVDEDGSLTIEQFKHVMNEYDHGYKEYQIEAMFDSLDWNETETINFNSLLTAFSYQRLVSVDERLWEAFAKLDEDNDGLITKAEIKRVLATVNPDGFDEGIKQLDLWQPLSGGSPEVDNESAKLTKEERRKKNMSLWIGECIIDVDWDDNGQIDYEEFLRALHPRFNEDPVTPRPLHYALDAFTPPDELQLDEKKPTHFFEPSVGSGLQYIPSNRPVGDQKDKEDEVNKKDFDTYINTIKKQNDND